jgi:hypothetical protein
MKKNANKEFEMETSKNNLDEVAIYVSLKSAIQSFFNTCQALSFVTTRPLDFKKISQITFCDIPEYQSSCFSSITHFQHFFELIIKDVLNRIDPLLVVKFDDVGVEELYCRLKGLDNPKSEKIQWITFRDALDRLKNIKEVILDDFEAKEISILLDNKDVLGELNRFRNGVWHKGVSFLNYAALDKFVGSKILPLVVKLFETLNYSGKKYLWYYKHLGCGLDPIKEIIDEFADNKNIDFEKVALLKELGRAAYHNPLVMGNDKICGEKEYCLYTSLLGKVNRDKIEVGLAKTKALCKTFDFFETYKCPVCGLKTLVRFVENECGDVEDENGLSYQYQKIVPFKIECQTCSFRIDPNIKNLSIISLDGNEIWKTEEGGD